MGYPKLTPIIAKEATEPRYLEDRFADVVNVKDFGAKGDGINDDYSVIQTALTALGGSGKTLFFPSGIYRLTASLKIPSKLRLLGEPGSVLKRDFVTGSTGSRVIGSLVPLTNETKIYDVEIIDIVFDGNGPSYPDTGFDIFVIANYPAYNITFDKCTFKNVVDLHALDIAYASNVDILNCRFIGFSNPGVTDEWASNKREAIQFDMGSLDDSFRNNKIRIENCYFGPSDEFGSWTTGIGNHGYLDTSDQCSDIIIKNNFFDNVLYCGITCMGLKNVLIDGNIIYTKGDGIQVIARHNSTLNIKAICENINIINNIIQGTNTSPRGDGFYLWCSAGQDISDVSNAFNKNISIHKNKILHIGTGVHCTCGENISIENNYFSVTYGYAGTIYKTKVNANIFDNLTQGGMYTSKGYHSLTNAKENIEYNKDFVVSSNIYINPAVRCIHISSDGKKNILVEKNVVFDSASQSAASAVTVGYIQVDSGRNNVIVRNNSVYADNARGVNYAYVGSDTYDILSDNKYIVNGVLKNAYDSSVTYETKNKYTAINTLTDSDSTTRGGLLFKYQNALKLGVFAANEILYLGGGASLFSAFGRVRITDKADASRGIDYIPPYFLPFPDNTLNLGGGGNRWATVYAATGSINTSDKRNKTDVCEPDEKLMRAWGKVKTHIFKFLDSVEEKGDKARKHTGFIAQEIDEAFSSEGLNANEYGLFCYDEWDDEYVTNVVIDSPAKFDDEGNEIEKEISHTEKKQIRKAGNRYSLRYEECLALECAYQRWRLEQLEERINQLTNSNK